MRGKGLLMTVWLLAVAGCGEVGEHVETVPLSQVPAPAMKAAREALRDIAAFESAWKGKGEGQGAYEIRGKTKSGKIRILKVTADGRVLEVD
jgi:hypothetical protein